MDSESAVTKGWLVKKAGLLKSRHWFWLLADKLMYSKAAPAVEGSTKYHAIDLSMAHQVRQTDSPCTFEIVSRKEHIILVAATQTECDDWVKALQVAMQCRRHISFYSDDMQRSLSTGCDGAIAGPKEDATEIREDNALERSLRAPSLVEYDVAARADDAPDGMSNSVNAAADVGKPAEPCHVLANYPTAGDLAAHLVRKKALLHCYENINSPEEQPPEVGDANTDTACNLQEKLHDRSSKRVSTTTHELVVLEADKTDRKTASNGTPHKRFSILTAPNASSSSSEALIGLDRRLKDVHLKNPSKSNAYEEIILEAEDAHCMDMQSYEPASAVEAPLADLEGTQARLVQSAVAEEDTSQVVSTSTTTYAEDSDSSAVYSQVKRQPPVTALAMDDAAFSDQPRPAPRFSQRSLDEQEQQEQKQKGFALIASAMQTAPDEPSPPLPLPRPAICIVEAEDDVYAKLHDCKSSEDDREKAVPSRDRTPSEIKPSSILAAELMASDVLRVRAYRPQPYSHAVSMLKEHLVREGAFGKRIVAHSS